MSGVFIARIEALPNYVPVTLVRNKILNYCCGPFRRAVQRNLCLK